MVVTGLGRIGVGTDAPHSSIQTRSIARSILNLNTGSLTLSDEHSTVRITDDAVTGITLPDPTLCAGRIYTLIGTASITSAKTLTISGTGAVVDDVTSTNVTSINASERYTIQSDGADYIVIGR